MTEERFREIKESVEFMRKRFNSGQGRMADAMCRLSLTMSEELIAEINRIKEMDKQTNINMEDLCNYHDLGKEFGECTCELFDDYVEYEIKNERRKNTR